MSLFASSSRDSKQQQLSTQTSPTRWESSFRKRALVRIKVERESDARRTRNPPGRFAQSQKYVCLEESKAHHSKIHGMTKDHLACIISSRVISSRVISSRDKRRPLRSLSQGSDESKWCKLHGRTDHTTEECRRINSMILEYGNTPQSQMMLNAATKIDELQTSAKVEIRRAKIEDDDAEKNAPASLPHQDDLPPPPKRQVR
ncbi:unnamed protein product [Microthlaspi erraticum]|uniref:Uncharacterized protein n=1 Tax=Microthlaspi erraticum TaxID=1685480 RepID=A0A6D2L8B4_9BRAS|nr:unnamed protein product [Microthlaspi erraticum]